VYGFRHESTPEGCPVCFPLPIDFGKRQEAIWGHALAQFVDQSGVDVSDMSRADLVPLVKSWARSNTVATLERDLRREVAPDPVAPRFERWSARLALFLMLAVFACLTVICSGVWRFLFS
jgi:hypothetical protein